LGILSRRIRLALGLLTVLACAPARGEDLDQGKSAQKLFADTCAACHKSAKGLTKRGYLTLYFFLRDHYASNSTSAWALTSYLESVDGGSPKAHSRKSANRSPSAPQVNGKPGAPPRPPEAVPQR
jgi:mono/diheme cytochrome c family protein